jgi:hypothetical protein
MNEEQWLSCTDATPMLELLRDRASDRKLRLFAVACCRRVWHLLIDGRSRSAVEVAERYADDEATEEDLYLAAYGAENVADAFAASSTTAVQEAQASAAFAALNATVTAARAADYSAANVASAVYHTATAAGAPSAARSREAERTAQSHLLRDIFGNPLRPTRPIGPTVLAWNERTVIRLAQSIYDDRYLPDGTLDGVRLAVLADALEEAGCYDQPILRHCREPGLVHVRGCWLLDRILGKE